MLILGCTYQPEAVKIGALLSLSDEASSAKNGIDLAVMEINQQKSLNAPLRVIAEESRCDTTQAEKAATKLILADGARAIISDICPKAAVAAAKVAQSNTAVLLSFVNITQEYVFPIESNASAMFVKLYEKVYNQTSDLHAAQGYNAVKMLADALKETDYTGRKLNEWFNSEHIPN